MKSLFLIFFLIPIISEAQYQREYKTVSQKGIYLTLLAEEENNEILITLTIRSKTKQTLKDATFKFYDQTRLQKITEYQEIKNCGYEYTAIIILNDTEESIFKDVALVGIKIAGLRSEFKF